MKTQTLLIALLLPATLLAEDLTTVSGKKYTGVTINRVEADGLAISHDDGLAKVPFSDLSEELRKKYGYDPQKAAQYQAAMQAASAQRAAAANAAAAAAKQNDPKTFVRILGPVKQSGKTGIIVDIYVAGEYIRDFGVSEFNDPKRPKWAGTTSPIGPRLVHLTGHPRQEQIVDGDRIDVDAVPDGTFTYEGGKINQFKIIKAYK